MRLYSDINEKERKWKENRERQIYRLNSAVSLKYSMLYYCLKV